MPKETLFTPEPLHENIVPKLDGFFKIAQGTFDLNTRLAIKYKSMGLIGSLIGTIIPSNHDNILAKIHELADEFGYAHHPYIVEVIHWVEIEKKRSNVKKPSRMGSGKGFRGTEC